MRDSRHCNSEMTRRRGSHIDIYTYWMPFSWRICVISARRPSSTSSHRSSNRSKHTMSRRPAAPNQTALALKNIATLLQTLPARLQTFRIKSESTSRKLSYTYEQRHRQIFPGRFDSTSSSSSAHPAPYSFSSDQLYDLLTSSYNPEHHVENIVVKSASYCKQTTGPKHEFIILEVEDLKSPGLKNFIALDRNNGDTPNRSTFASIQSSQSVAKDEFRVSYDGNKGKLLDQCNLREHDSLETIEFQPEAPLFLYQIATLTRAVSHQRDKYHVITANCYWFAGLIWDCMVRMRPSAARKELKGNIRGAFIGWLHHSTNVAELEVTYRYVDNELLNTDEKISIQKQQWANNYDAYLKGDLETYTKRIQELEALLKTAADASRH
ncbi:unnamed protein product [Rhizoctonia solani]|uniref:PPPDE domain-containing protein n=1 Tax=Rhizoctonia solani TaxID=456999 RepID=A0A8H3GHE4_9AGAM|nr:unnamed protein product [Rhizoctonia solani]